MPLELIVGAAVGAAVASPTIRKTIRRGIVYGLAGVLVAYDKAARLTHGVVSEARHEVEAPAAQGQGGTAPSDNQAAPSQPSSSAPA